MTTEQDESRLSGAEVREFLEKLGAWAAGLARNEREFLMEILNRAGGCEAADAGGFLMRAQPYEPGVRPVPSPDSGPGGLSSIPLPSAGGGFGPLPYPASGGSGGFGGS